jgi:hypothetical protein
VLHREPKPLCAQDVEAEPRSIAASSRAAKP